MRHFAAVAIVGVCLFIGLVWGFVCVSIIGNATHTVDGRMQTAAQAEADRFLRKMGIEGTAVCVNADTDQDGYVSCPYTQDGALHALECAGSLTMNTGCRIPKVVAPQ